MTARELVTALGGRWYGSYGVARCPSHDDRTPSLSISTGKDDNVLLYCHAGCDQGVVIDTLRAHGLWKSRHTHAGRSRPYKQCKSADIAPERDDTKKTERALRIWRETVPASSTVAETYLQSRGLNLPIPSILRFHAELRHPSGDVWPTMVALVTRGPDDARLAIHRTFLARDGSDKAPVEPQKMMLGPCRGGAVRLGTPGDVLMIGEGVETCLTAMQATGNSAWAALSTSGLRTLDLPNDAREVVVLADGDAPGEAAAHACAIRWQREGRRVRIARPPQGFDFNDMLLGRTSHVDGDAA